MENLNLGVGGYNPYTEAELFRDVGPSYQPDLVIAQFCINDLGDPTAHFSSHSRKLLGTIPDAAYPEPSRRKSPLEDPYLSPDICRFSRVCGLVEERLRRFFGPRLVQPGSATRSPGVEDDDGRETERWQWIERRYAELATASAGTGSAFAVLVVPYRDQLADGLETAQTRLKEIGERRGWPMIDPLPEFRRAAADAVDLDLTVLLRDVEQIVRPELQ